jgi:hypothetical protein
VIREFLKQNILCFFPKHIFILCAIVVTWVNFNQVKWTTGDVIVHDIAKYYSYLPAAFYEKDLSLSFLYDSINRDQETKFYAPNRSENGATIIKMSAGMAFTYLPFFLMADGYARLFNYPVDGFSEPYQFAVQFGTLVYYLIGLFFLKKILESLFERRVVTLALFCITFSTHVFYYLTLAAGLSHIIGFTVSCIFIVYTLKWHDTPTFRFSLILGLCLGFLALVRPINVLFGIFFVLYGVTGLRSFSEKLRLFLRNWLYILVVAMSAFVIFLPQMIYWKVLTGHFLYNSYVGEGFYFLKPHILEAIFGFRKGWLIYTPVMVFGILGFVPLYQRHRVWFLPVLMLFVIYVYVVFSWWCWWYGGSFGQRVLIDIYPFLCIPLALILEKCFQTKKAIKVCVVSFVVFCTLLNLFQTIQAKYNILHYDAMTRENYFQIFGTITTKPDREKYLDHPDYEKARRGEQE